MTHSTSIFDAFTLPNGAVLKNRIMMAPMTTCCGFYDGTVTQDLIDYYKERAGEIGTVIVECGFVDPKGLAFPGALGLDSDDKIAGLAKIAKVIHDKGSKAIIQVYHGGRMVEKKLIGGETPVAPSAIAAPRPNAPTPIELSAQEVDELIIQFGNAVKRAIKAGFDGVELHGANTYLLQQFFSPNSNQRTDKWGGSRKARAQFPLEILKLTHETAKKYAAKDFIIGYRFSPEEIETPGIRFEDTLYLLEQLAQVGLDYVHFSMGYTLRGSLVDTDNSLPLIDRFIQQRQGALKSVPVVGVGNIVNRVDIDVALEHGYDLVAVGRACIAYPNWTKRIQNGESLSLTILNNQRERLKIPEPLWTFPLVASLIRDPNEQNKKYKPGVYTEQASDETHEYSIQVTLAKESIEDLSLENHQQFDTEINDHFLEIKHKIIEANSPHVDVISGATTQCEAFKKAVSKAISKSTKLAIIEEGGDPNQQSVDIVVIGSGGAGLAAAIQAYDKGAKVLIVEKMSVIGGNTTKASAGMNAAETKFQKLKGIKDNKALFFKETLKGGQNKNNPDLLHYFVEKGADAIEWLDEHGIALSSLTTTGGMSIDRTHRPESGEAVGGFLISRLVKNVNQRQIEVLLETSVTKIHQENGRVTGVTIVNEDEKEPHFIAAKAVIVATGGFSANKEMVAFYRPELKGFVTTNHDGATGSGIKLLEQLGAATVDMKEIQIHPTVEQTTRYLISESIRGGGAILVNQNGNRFYNEMETRDKVSAEVLKQDGAAAWLLFDDQVRKENPAANEYIAQGFVKQADSLELLAHQLNVPADHLEQTIKTYNQSVATQHDQIFNRTTGMRHSISEAPFYAIKIAPGVHHTMGGVVINCQAEVLNANHELILGAFAAGEVTGGIHGANRIGGNAVADIIIFGLRAAQSAVDYIDTEIAGSIG